MYIERGRRKVITCPARFLRLQRHRRRIRCRYLASDIVLFQARVLLACTRGRQILFSALAFPASVARKRHACRLPRGKPRVHHLQNLGTSATKGPPGASSTSRAVQCTPDTIIGWSDQAFLRIHVVKSRFDRARCFRLRHDFSLYVFARLLGSTGLLGAKRPFADLIVSQSVRTAAMRSPSPARIPPKRLSASTGSNAGPVLTNTFSMSNTTRIRS
jgi:hypothetical protein